MDRLGDDDRHAVLEAIYRDAPFAILIADPDRNVITFNAAFEDLFGYTTDEIAGQPTRILYANAEEYQRASRYFEDETGRIPSRMAETYYRKKNGDVFLANVRGQMVFGDDGEPVAVLGVFRNISEQKQMEFQYEHLFRYAPVLIMQKDADGRVVRINDEYAEFLGFRPEEVIGRPSSELQPPVAELIREDDERVLRSGEPLLGALRKLWSPARGEGWILLNKIPLVDPITGETTLLSIGMDVTDLKKREAELEARSAALESFAYMASHDLQEPMRKIATFGSLLTDPESDAAEREFAVNAMVGSAKRARTMIADLLTYSRASNEELKRTGFALSKLIDAVLEALSWSIREAEAEIDVAVGGHWIEADRLQSELLMQNLLSNALKYRDPETPCRISVTAGHEDGSLRLSVRDNGIGIEPKHAESVFLPFVRLHARTEYPGSGIGLAICKAVADRHGWTIRARPLPQGGTEFLVDIPSGETAEPVDG